MYNDNTDNISDSDDVGAVTTEPSDGNYARQTVTLDGTDVTISQVSGEIQANMEVTFDVTNTTGTINAAMALNDFQSDVVGADGSPTTHHIWSATIGEADLANFTGDFIVTLDSLEDDA